MLRADVRSDASLLLELLLATVAQANEGAEQ